jgi:hypothetical protein
LCAAASDALAADDQTHPEQCAAEQMLRPGAVSRASDRVLGEQCATEDREASSSRGCVVKVEKNILPQQRRLQ